MERLPFVMEAAVVDAARRTAEPDGDGWTRVTLPMESIGQAASDLLRLGADAEVLVPAELRERVRQMVADLAEVYARDV
jgi:predicted DNA-binding transcriptional regulator YafY